MPIPFKQFLNSLDENTHNANHIERLATAARAVVGSKGSTARETEELIHRVRSSGKTSGKDYRRLARLATGS